MSALTDAANRYRAELLASERAAASRLVRDYLQVYANLKHSLSLLTADIQAARDAGQTVGSGWLYRQARYQSLLTQITDEVSRFARSVELDITDQQRNAIAQAEAQALQLTLFAMGAAPLSAQTALSAQWNRLPVDAIENMVGMLAPGTTLSDALNRLAPESAAAGKAALVRGVALGKGLDAIANEFRDAMGGTLDSALRTTRTAVLNAKRNAQLQSYRANPVIVKAWRWIAAIGDPRTCPVCIALHGTIHPMTELFSPNHWGCRCSNAPVTATWAELGFPDIPEGRTPVESGVDWFARQSPEKQRTILGPAAHAAYKDGVSLEQFVGKRDDPIFGTQYVQRSLRSIVGEDQAQRYLRVGLGRTAA